MAASHEIHSVKGFGDGSTETIYYYLIENHSLSGVYLFLIVDHIHPRMQYTPRHGVCPVPGMSRVGIFSGHCIVRIQ